jgi:peptidoglycan-associated lipoprotein
MKLRILTIVPLLALLLLVGGCASTPGEGSAGDGTSTGGSGFGDGATTAGAVEGGSWTGRALDDPASPLSTRVILFDFDVSEIRADYRDVVIAHGEYLAANPTVTVTIEGHTDERGSREYNVGLGERRANAVKRLMLAQGAFETQIVTVSYGEERPLALGSDEAAWAENRRAEILY